MSAAGAGDPDSVAGETAAEVRRRLAAGVFNDSLLGLVGRDGDSQEADTLSAAAEITLDQEPVSSRRMLGPLAVNVKRAVRRLTGWYVQPLATQQTAFNLILLERIAALERRLDGLGPVWSRPRGSPPPEGGGGDLTTLRATAVRDAAGAAPAGAVLLGGPNAAQLLQAVTDIARELIVTDDVMLELASDDGAPFAVIVLAGVLPLLGAHELLACLPAAAARLVQHGVLLADAPVDVMRDPAHRRTIDPDMLRELADAAGFHVDSLDTHRAAGATWCALRATREH